VPLSVLELLSISLLHHFSSWNLHFQPRRFRLLSPSVEIPTDSEQ
jgi:hypothetical protein